MKKQRIFLLLLVLVMALAISSCGAGQSVPECFVFEPEATAEDFSELDGEIIGVNRDYGILALKTEKTRSDGDLESVVKIYDVYDENRVVFEQTKYYNAKNAYREIEYDISSYPMIKTTEYINKGEDEYGITEYEPRYYYYLINGDYHASLIASYLEEDDLEVEEVGNLFLIEADGRLIWVSGELKVLREIPLDVAKTYRDGNYESYFEFEAEYFGYLYTWEFDLEAMSQVILVYDHHGIASAKYSFPEGTVSAGTESIISPHIHVLNDGNVLIQECVHVEDGEEYDFEYVQGEEIYKLDLRTKIMSYIDGTVNELDFDYLIRGFEAGYSHDEDGDFAFRLAEGYDNQAFLVPIEDGRLGRTMEYVILSNDLDRVYTLPNRHLIESSSFNSIFDADENGYKGYVLIDGSSRICHFNWAGEITFVYPTNFEGETDTHYVTHTGVYTKKDNKLVIDLESEEYQSGMAQAVAIGNDIYLAKENPLAMLGDMPVHEIYKLDKKSGKLELIDDGKEGMSMILSEDGVRVYVNYDTEVTSFFNAEGELILRVRDNAADGELISIDGALIVSAEVDGKMKVFTINGPFDFYID
ncbi:MAG: hypothetical protein IKC32_00990 [Clostridia bacterium]|nr:hypothetical protein [Clostridia bacterium]